MPKYNFQQDDSIEFSILAYDATTVRNNILSSHHESIDVTIQGEKFKEENINEAVVQVFFKFLSKYKEGLRSLT